MSGEDDFFWDKKDIDWKKIFQNIEREEEKIKVSYLAEYLESNLEKDFFKSQYIHIIVRSVNSGVLEIDEKNEDIRENKVWLSSSMKLKENSIRKDTKQADFSEF